MHSVTIDNPAIFPNRTRRSLRFRWFTLQRRILIILARPCGHWSKSSQSSF